jgi:hypothetical protein
MSKSLTLNCGGCVDYRLHLGFNEQYRAPIHKIQHQYSTCLLVPYTAFLTQLGQLVN